jgi:hypothetical protein
MVAFSKNQQDSARPRMATALGPSTSGLRRVGGASVLRQGYEAQSRRHSHQVRERVRLHLSHFLASASAAWLRSRSCRTAHNSTSSEWPRQELDRSRLHGLDRRRHVAVPGDEDDRHVDPIDRDALLQIETIEASRCRLTTPRDSGRIAPQMAACRWLLAWVGLVVCSVATASAQTPPARLLMRVQLAVTDLRDA